MRQIDECLFARYTIALFPAISASILWLQCNRNVRVCLEGGGGEGVCWKLNLGMRIECGHEDWAAIWSAFAYQQLLNMWLQVLTYISHTSQMPKEKCLLRLKNSLRFNPTIRIRGTCTLTLSLSFPSNTIVMSEGGILTSNSPCLCILSQLPVWVYLLYTQLAVWIYLLHT